MTPFQRVCTALERVTGTVRYSSDGRQAQAHCPGPTHSHGDRNPSLSVSVGDDGRALLQCFAGCATEAIVATLGLKMADLFPDRPPSRIVAEYSYRDESGAVLYQNVRYEPKTFRMRRPGDGDGGQWVWDTKGVRRVLYRLPELRDQRRVVLVEGEKDADRLWSLSIPATTTVGGANSWRSEYAEQLQSAGVQEVVILPDNDDPGRGYAAQAEGALREGQIAVATLEFSDLPEGGDVSDWLDAGGDPEQLRAAIAAAPTRRIPGHDDTHDDHDTEQEALDLIDKARGLEPGQRACLLDPFLDLVARMESAQQDMFASLGQEVWKYTRRGVRDTLRQRRESRENAQDVVAALAEQQQLLDARRAECQALAASVLAAADPLALVKAELQRLGYGGDLTPAVIAYLAATSRLLVMRPGAMPAHLLILGAASTGKSWTVSTVLALLPEWSYVRIDAGSPRALIYSDADFQHHVLVFSEADSLPRGEDNAAASAIRTLLQEHRLTYDVVVRDPESGEYVVKRVEKPGPTTMLTTSVRRLGEQLDTRVFTLDAPEDLARVRAALDKQAQLELHPPTPPDPALVAYQGYLQLQTPWDVVVPFADTLAERIGRSIPEPRIVRDYAKLLALIKALCVVRHVRRQRDADGRLIATLDDYLTVRELVAEMYEGSTSGGASEGVRAVVEAVARLTADGTHPPVSSRQVATALGIGDMASWRRVKVALKAGWLVNEQQSRHGRARLVLGESLPPRGGLPEAETLAARRPADDSSANGDDADRDGDHDHRASRNGHHSGPLHPHQQRRLSGASPLSDSYQRADNC